MALWDVLTGRVERTYGRSDLAGFEKLEKQLFQPLTVAAWFSADHKLGALTLTMEPPGCFAAEVYAADLGHQDVADDLKLNLGKLLLEMAFARWQQQQQRLQDGAGRAAVSEPAASSQGDGGAAAGGGEPPTHLNATPAAPGKALSAAGREPRPPWVAWQRADGTWWLKPASQLTGQERDGEDVPPWVGDALLRNAVVGVKDGKATFILQPAPGSGLPSFLQSKLNAPKILQVRFIPKLA